MVQLQMIYQTDNMKFTLYGSVHSLKWINFCVVCGADFTGGTSNSSTLVRRTDTPPTSVLTIQATMHGRLL